MTHVHVFVLSEGVTAMSNDQTILEPDEGPGPEPDVADQTDPESFTDPEPDVPEGEVDVSDIEEGPDDGLESVSRLQRPGVSVARARSHSSGFSGQCLHFVWLCLDGQHSYGLRDANAAFKASQHLHSDGSPPAGTPVYFLGSKHGHVALSVGGGRIRSTDWPSSNRISEVKISELSQKWGRRYAGWASDMAGHPIPGLATNAPALKAAARRPFPGQSTTPGDQGATVKVIQDRLNALGARLAEDGRFGPATEAAVKGFQRSHGLEMDGHVGPKTWAALFG
jgi:hypothetical protein